VFVDGKDVGLLMLRQSFTWVYDRYITEASTEVQETYRKAQEEAKAEQRGLWSDPNSIPRWIIEYVLPSARALAVFVPSVQYKTLALVEIHVKRSSWDGSGRAQKPSIWSTGLCKPT
jgi:Staphylococcal nuclease homologue